MKTFVLAVVFLCLPSLALADEETDAARAPRMGIEIQNYWAGSVWWQEGFDGGVELNPSLGFGVLEPSGGALLRVGYVPTGQLGAPEHQQKLNFEAVLWMPWQASSRADWYLAFGPAMQFAESERNRAWNPGFAAEAGFDSIVFSWARIRWGLKAHLYPNSNFDLGLVFSSPFFSWPL